MRTEIPPEKTLSSVHMFIEVVFPALPPHRAGADLKNGSLGTFPPRATWLMDKEVANLPPGPRARGARRGT